MDITDLNMFAWCACLKHLGKTIMFLVVGAIIGLACYATFSSALLPGIENSGAGATFGYILLSILYLTTVRLFPLERNNNIFKKFSTITATTTAAHLIFLSFFLFQVFMVLWSYIATMTTDPGTTPPGWHPFELHQLHDEDIADDIEAGGDNNQQLSTSSLHDPLLAMRLSDHFQASTRLQQQHAASHRHTTRNAASSTEEEQEVPDDVHYQAALAVMQRPRWCRKCSAWKPPRSHHDSMTKRCVLKMDHYCVWVGNTVGLLNYRHFVLFLFWAGLGCVMR
jgi:hypothetical protein